MKTFGTRSRKVLALSCGVVVVAVLGLLPRQSAAQTNSDPNEAVKPGAQRPLAETKSGPFTLTVDRVRHYNGGRTPEFASNGFSPFGSAHSPSKMDSMHKTNEKTFTGPDGRSGGMTSGGGGAGGGGSGGGSGGAFFAPNLIIDLELTLPSLKGKQQLICCLSSKPHAADDQGRVVEGPDGIPGKKWVIPGVDYRQEPNRTAVHLFLPPESQDSKYLQSLEGELLVAKGTVNQFTFSESELAQPTIKRSEGMSARVEKVSSTPKGVAVVVALSPPVSKSAEEAKQRKRMEAMSHSDDSNENMSPQEHMRRFMESSKKMAGRNPMESRGEHNPRIVGLTMLDSQGNKHSGLLVASKAGSSSSGKTSFESRNGSGGGSSGGASWGSSSKSGSGGSSWGPGGADKKTWSSDDDAEPAGSNENKGSNGKNTWPTATFQFDPLPDGVKAKSITCTVSTCTTEPKLISFRFDRVPLAESRQ